MEPVRDMSQLQALPTAYVFFDDNGNQVSITVAQAYDLAFHLTIPTTCRAGDD